MVPSRHVLKKMEQECAGSMKRRAPQFLARKCQSTKSEHRRARIIFPGKEKQMEYLIALALVSMAALYAFIITGCTNQSEW